MRPVLLEMTGFGSFREPTTVDFTNAGYFALVGPTGAGKSTVIDAIIFALYGTVPRWNNRGTVSLALTPTVSRGVVRFVFEVGTARYVAARELRRTTVGVGIRNGRLERLIDPSRLGTADDESELIAADGQVNGAVEKLLGLSFKHFCSCVVLPQGDFAKFLHEKPSNRQRTLTRLLGIDIYETIAQRAGIEASAAKQRAIVLDEQIGRLAGATQHAEDEAHGRVQRLMELNDYVTAVLPELAAATTVVEDARRNVGRIGAEQAQLSALTVPTDLGVLTERLAAAYTAAHEADSRLGIAELSDDAARAALEAAPARGPLEQVRRNHAEHATLAQQQPDAEQRRTDATQTLSTATANHDRATSALAAAHAAAEAVSTAAAAANSHVATLRAAHTTLTNLAAPPGVADIGNLENSTINALAAAHGNLAEAERVEIEARRELDAAHVRSTLDQAKRDCTELAGILASQPGLDHQLDQATQQREAAVKVRDDAQHAVIHARAARDEAARTDAAAALRPHLVTGQPCPVCEHPVSVLPTPLDHTSLAVADQALTQAEQHLRTADEAHVAAVSAERKARSAVETAAASVTRLRQALPGSLADAKAVDAELSRLGGLTAALHGAAASLRQARTDHDAARTAADAMKTRLVAERAALNAARDTLVPLGAPPLDHLDLSGAWGELVAWAKAEATARSGPLRHATADADAAAALSAAHAETLAHAQAELARVDAAKVAATRADQEAATELRQLHKRLAELADTLAAAPDDAHAANQLARIGRLEDEAKAAREELQVARTASKSAAATLTAMQAGEQTAWNALRTARDPLVALGAPPVQHDDLLAAWTTLKDWATIEAQNRATSLAAAKASLQEVERTRDETERALIENLQRAEIALPSDRPASSTVAAATASELQRARDHLRNIRDQRDELDSLLSSRAAAETDQQVAHMLALLLRSTEFPRWLVASALDVLVQDASASLAELSGGQFDLTHEDGEFVIIDHTNADLHRPVKTLSGGETFQASLALALALSAQMATLAAAGSVQLDSIFLDEGFGTLDEATLDMVATTLENLASQSDRMVGVVSHVSALADRVPVKFRVSRDQFGSTITRDDS